ncbi:MAG: hypothetical protein QXG48_01815 [Thermofilaceae archaeon]
MTCHYLVTTTHRSNPRVRSLAKELALSLPNALKVNRGKSRLLDVLLQAKTLGALRVLIVGRGLMGNPGRIEVFKTLDPPYTSLVLKLSGVKLARELATKPQPPRSLAVLVQREQEALEFGHELAAAMNLPLVEDAKPEELANVYDSLLLIAYVKHPRTLFALKFVKPESRQPRGPRLLVEKYAVIKRGSI